MKQAIVIAAVTLSWAFAQAQTQIAGNVQFGAQDARGAYQEVRVNVLSVTANYFDSNTQRELQNDAKQQVKYDIWSDSDSNMQSWGRRVELTFQDGELKTQNAESTDYKLLDKTRAYAVAYATLAFDNKAQAQTNVYRISGIVTLVTGSYMAGPMGNKGPSPEYKQSAVMGYRGSGAYYNNCNPDCKGGGQFNELGNGKNDGGRITSVGLVSKDPSPMTIDLLKSAMGSLVEVLYP